MAGFLERHITDIDRRLQLLSPSSDAPCPRFANVTYDTQIHQSLVRAIQAFRGDVYLQEGNIRRDQLTPDGLHRSPEDAESWHLVMSNDDGTVSSCGWYRVHRDASSIDDLRVRHCPLVKEDEWRGRVSGAIRREIVRARRAKLGYAELGGWAVSPERRRTPDGFLLAMAGYGLARILGGALGITTANVIHSSSSILQRLGGSQLRVRGSSVPAYFDARYNTMIELLRFDSRKPAAKYGGLIDTLTTKLLEVPVISTLQALDDAVPVGAMAGMSPAELTV